MTTNDPKTIKKKYKLREHVEGGWFAEVYTAPADKDGRPLMGSIYFLLGSGCDIPIDSDPENALRFMDTVRKCGPARLGQKPAGLYNTFSDGK